MSSDQHDRIVELLEEYALDQLGPDEREAVEAHLRGCRICEQILRETEEALTLLAETVPPVQPPPALKARVLSSIQGQTLNFVNQVREQPTRGQARNIRSAPQPWRWLAWAALVLVTTGLAALLYRAESERHTLSLDVQRANADATNLRERLQRFSVQTDLALSILTAADMRELPLAGRENAVAAAARAYWSPTRGLLVVADRLPTPPPGRIYQVWIIERGQPLSAGLLGDQSEGRGMLVAPPPRPNAGTAVTIAVTDEPPGGLTAPSGVIQLAGSI
jgi:anti-sigma-K factor RskA